MKSSSLSRFAPMAAIFVLAFGGMTPFGLAQDKPETNSDPVGFLSGEGSDIVATYDQAVAHLEKVCDDYRRIRALKLMRKRDLAFADAYENISSVMPALEPINRRLLRKALRDPSDIIPHKKEVERVESEIEGMIVLVAKLLLEIEKIKVVEKLEAKVFLEEQAVTLEEIVQREEFDPAEVTDGMKRANLPKSTAENMKELSEAAKEDAAMIAKDLTPIMRKMKPTPADEEAELTKKLDPTASDAPHFSSKTDDLNVLNKVTNPAVKNFVFGRKIMEEGTSSEWMFIDTWRTIGPFPNPARLNINRTFPPETIIDFDARYEGKGKQMVQWEFVQSGAPMVIPANDQEYAIYYAYTEAYFERSMDLWVAIGSDDRGEVWLNDAPIWISGEQLKGWKIAEGYRKVRFEAGINRILFRIENGWRATSFSFGIRVAN